MNIKTIDVSGWVGAFYGMRNPLASHAKSDSRYDKYLNFIIGPNDMQLIQKLIKGGPEHAKALLMIHVQANFDMPRYWCSEMDTYHFNTKNSFSTMHKLLNNDNPITKEQFVNCEEDADVLDIVIQRLEDLRREFKAIQHDEHNDSASDKAAKMNALLVRAKRLLPE